MPLLRLDQASLSLGSAPLFDDIDIQLEPGERIGLLGRNGAGKSTLLKTILGQQTLDSGNRWVGDTVTIGYLDQVLPPADDQCVYDVVASGLEAIGQLLKDYHAATLLGDMKKMTQVQHKLEASDGWRLNSRIDRIIQQLGLDPDQSMKNLSGGWRRRVALARVLVSEPDILLLDEPTNHLDLPAIAWLEELMLNFRGALLFVTHDRAFLQRVANAVWELDRGKIRCWSGDYPSFLRFREEQLNAEQKANAEFDKKLAQEEAWIRQGIKARRTRNEGRVRALKAMRLERSQRRELQGKSRISLETADRTGKKVVELTDVSLGFSGRPIIKHFSTLVMRGDRIGIVGVNGAGKTTLVKLMLGEIKPDSGKVELGTNLEVAYFDQLRQQLNPERTVLDTICEGRESIEINGKSRHGISYLSDFLFSPDRCRVPIKALSGGEQSRVILAKLFSKPANVLVLDEPTNDLDMETLELLEDCLAGFDGTVLLVSHDRAFMDNVITSLIILKGNGELEEQVGGYQDWIDRGGQLVSAEAGSEEKAEAPVRPSEPELKPKQRVKLSYKDQRELDQLPEKIEALDQQVARLEDSVMEPSFYSGDPDEVKRVLSELEQTRQQLDASYQRWEELEALVGGNSIL